MSDTHLSPGVGHKGLRTWHIAFFIIAVTAPLATVVGTVPVGFILGTGAGMPAAFLAAGLVMLCFMGGFGALASRVSGGGALYAYVRHALGRVTGAGTASLAVLSYLAFNIGVAGAFGYFASHILPWEGIAWPWYSAAAIVVTAVLGRREADISAKALGLLIVGEILILAVMDFGIFKAHGIEALPVASFSPSVALGGGLSAALAFAFTAYIGVDSAALYTEETRQPHKSIPRGGYWAIGIITVFYGLTTWLAVGGVGAENIRAAAAEAGSGLMFGLTAEYTSTFFMHVMQYLMITSLLATLIAVHNATSRYMFTLSRESLLPRFLGHAHPTHGTPARASVAVTVITAIVVGWAAVTGIDPYLGLGIATISLATVGIMTLMVVASIACIVYFARNGEHSHWWSTKVAPALATLGLGAAVVLIFVNYPSITNSTSPVINGLPYLMPIVIVGGIARAAWLKRHSPNDTGTDPEQPTAAHPTADRASLVD